MKRLKEICIITLIMIVLGVTYSFATTGTANTNGIRIRKEPSTDAEILTNIHNGDSVEIIEKTGDWYKVKFEEYEGYAHSDYIKANGTVPNATEVEEKPEEKLAEETPTEETPEETPTEVTYPVNVKTKAKAKVYIIPSVTSSTIMEIASGSTVTVNNKVNNWSHITSGNREGWIRNFVLEAAATNTKPETEEPETPTNTSDKNKPPFTNGYVNVEAAVMREKATTSSEAIQELKENTEVKVVELVSAEDNDWYKIEYNGKTGYMAARLVSEKKTETTSRGGTQPRETTSTVEDAKVIKTGYVNVGLANVREKATTSSKIVTTLRQKAKVSITGTELSFYKIKVNGREAYISKDLVSNSLKDIEALEKEEDKVTTSSGSSSGKKIADYAKKYLGYKYVYGGTSPKGFDCSGFTYYVLKSCGYSVNRSCSSQAKLGKSVSKANLQVGDLVFFNNTSDGSIRTCWYICRRRKLHTCSKYKKRSCNRYFK